MASIGVTRLNTTAVGGDTFRHVISVWHDINWNDTSRRDIARYDITRVDMTLFEKKSFHET